MSTSKKTYCADCGDAVPTAPNPQYCEAHDAQQLIVEFSLNQAIDALMENDADTVLDCLMRLAYLLVLPDQLADAPF